jgi:hypothetical protein
VYNHPELDNSVEKWRDPKYISDILSDKKYPVEVSDNNHFMYWRRNKKGRKSFPDWNPPTTSEHMTYSDWLHVAITSHTKTLEEATYRYFRAASGENPFWVKQDLPFFGNIANLFIVSPRTVKGVHCRFGMKEVIAEAHWDGSRNTVAMLGGLRRWIMAKPDNCEHMYIYPANHPSGRHSSVDWSDVDWVDKPDFKNAMLNEVILQAGDILYVPTDWIHYIQNFGINYQCNVRSGVDLRYRKMVDKCKNMS